ncbi:succinylglutamate desuccinylase/aspartoacylase family protein [Radicibacter daui]|uniref:succinylglutamate desuccinylase/aspartoacylase family protein n=1 Tax=Radicibacter daui TaxID=3064829 RepID=UPI004046B395
MPVALENIALPLAMPGTQRTLAVYRFTPATGASAGKCYIQAALHADEIPGMLAARHLITLLEAADREGRIAGEIIVVPAANPIGLSQVVSDSLLGRFNLDDRTNFNRHYPELAAPVAQRIDGKLGMDAAANVALVRKTMGEVLDGITPRSETDALRLTLMKLSYDADIVLDLHCDNEAPVHVYLGEPLWPAGRDLCADLGSEVQLVARVSGDEPFDEANSAPWWLIADLIDLGDAPLPAACLAATVELRGLADVSPEIAGQDAANILRFLTRRGLVKGEAGPLPALKREATPLAGVELLAAPVAGIVSYRKQLGDLVKAGEVVADIIDPVTGASTPVAATVDGPLWSRRVMKMVPAGRNIAKISGSRALEGKGKLLLTAR